ncbi:MAG: hypothetical protein IKP88_14060 [Lachnospiraceae bacterium]|nr:hypothetical protein [Lachnospiraceae bacterium]
MKTVTFAITPADVMGFAGFLDNLRTDDVFKECIGVPDGTSIQMERCFAFPFREYGDAKEACIEVGGNSMKLMLIFPNYRVVYSLIAENQWRNVEMEVFAGTLVKYNYDFFNRLNAQHIKEIDCFFRSKLIAGRDNLYSSLGSDASNPEFLKNYIYSVILGKNKRY